MKTKLQLKKEKQGAANLGQSTKICLIVNIGLSPRESTASQTEWSENHFLVPVPLLRKGLDGGVTSSDVEDIYGHRVGPKRPIVRSEFVRGLMGIILYVAVLTRSEE